ncbi:MAG TPA: DinB family protein [Candidatus Kapabacteria bacterium]
MIITPPNDGDYPEYYKRYISLVAADDVLKYFRNQTDSLSNLLDSIASEKLHYRYAEGKWTVADVAQHVMDTERVFCYRMLTFSRGDKVEIAGFEEDEYAKNADTSARTADSIISEYKAVRAATLTLLENLNKDGIERSGIANGRPVSVRAIAYMIAGHELHHLGVIKERYL